MMKYIKNRGGYKMCFRFVLALLAGIGLMATPVAAAARPLKIVTSFYPMRIMALNVTRAVPDVVLGSLASSGAGCLHDYALTSGDMKQLADADVFIANGAGMEPFLERVAARYPGLKIITLAEGLPLVDGNPHVWVSVDGAIAEVGKLAAELAKVDPPHAALYRQNASAYTGKLEVLRDGMKAALAPYRGKGIITFHEAFVYFAREFGLNIVAVVEREPGSEPGAKELAATIETVKASGIKALFSEPQYPDAAARTIARETGAEVYLLDPAVTGPDDPGAYLAIMTKNSEVLAHALSK